MGRNMFSLSVVGAIGVLCTPNRAQTTTRVSVGSGGVQGNSISYSHSRVASDRYVAFWSLSNNVVPGDTNDYQDVFVHDLQTGQTERVSVSSSGAEGNGSSTHPSISEDGRYVAFISQSTNLVGVPVPLDGGVFVHDRHTGQTVLASVDSGGTAGNQGGHYCAISSDGRWVAFASNSTNLVSGDTNGVADIFVHDLQVGATERISVNSSGVQANSSCMGYCSISGTGRYVSFYGFANNLVPNDTNGGSDVFVRDRTSGTTERVSVDSNGIGGLLGSYVSSISDDGRFVAFVSDSPNLAAGDLNGAMDVFVHDRQSTTTELVSIDTMGVHANGPSHWASISGDGQIIAFHSEASNLVAADSNTFQDAFVHDRSTGQTTLCSVGGVSGQADHESYVPIVSINGRFVTFGSFATNLVPGDTNNWNDVFVRDRVPPPPFLVTAFCFGDGSETACPCGNTGQVGKGCENSIATGGALLVGSGEALLSADTLTLTASGERPTSVSVFWQGGSEIAPRPFGDGIGCIGPPLKRLYTRNAVGGTVSAPQGSDLSVSSRSAAVGDPITPGTSRIYHAFYRDGAATFCPEPAGSSFNVTGGLRVRWGP